MQKFITKYLKNISKNPYTKLCTTLFLNNLSEFIGVTIFCTTQNFATEHSCDITVYLWIHVVCCVVGEMWVGICLTVVVELVPTPLRTSAVAVYLFIISNIGGNLPLLVPPLQKAFINGGSSTVAGLRSKIAYSFYLILIT